MLKPGTILQGRYDVIDVINEGGMSIVYLATDSILGNRVAVKEMKDHFLAPQELQAAALQFKKEAQILANLEHVGLPKVTNFFEQDRKHYLVMDFIKGKTLETMVQERGGPLPEEQVLQIMFDVCKVLDYLHNLESPIIFRDLKPSNIMLTDDQRVKLIDFGISKNFDTKTATRTIIKGAGTPGFAPPEQYGTQGRTRTDARSDLYSLGATMYSLLTMEIPAEATDRWMNGVPLVPPRQIYAPISTHTETVILKLMELRPDDRYSSAREVLEAMRRYRPDLRGMSGEGQARWEERLRPEPEPTGPLPAPGAAPRPVRQFKSSQAKVTEDGTMKAAPEEVADAASPAPPAREEGVTPGIYPYAGAAGLEPARQGAGWPSGEMRAARPPVAGAAADDGGSFGGATVAPGGLAYAEPETPRSAAPPPTPPAYAEPDTPRPAAPPVYAEPETPRPAAAPPSGGYPTTGPGGPGTVAQPSGGVGAPPSGGYAPMPPASGEFASAPPPTVGAYGAAPGSGGYAPAPPAPPPPEPGGRLSPPTQIRPDQQQFVSPENLLDQLGGRPQREQRAKKSSFAALGVALVVMVLLTVGVLVGLKVIPVPWGTEASPSPSASASVAVATPAPTLSPSVAPSTPPASPSVAVTASPAATPSVAASPAATVSPVAVGTPAPSTSPPASQTRVLVTTEPEGATVFVDGQKVGQTSSQALAHTVAAGPHKVKVKMNGYLTQTQAVKVEAGQEKAVGIKLVKESTLDVKCNVAGAQVFVDDAPVGKAPMKVTGLAKGKHRVRVTAGGYIAESLTVTVGEGEHKDVSLTLAARPVQPVYTPPVRTYTPPPRPYTPPPPRTVPVPRATTVVPVPKATPR